MDDILAFVKVDWQWYQKTKQNYDNVFDKNYVMIFLWTTHDNDVGYCNLKWERMSNQMLGLAEEEK